MELKTELVQPYTYKEREDFIVEQNHKLGYEIRQVETTYEVEIQVPSIIKETITETVQEPVLDDDGNPILDEDGNPTVKEKIVEREVERTETEIVTEEIQAPVLDEEGNPVLDEEGNPIFETQMVEKEVVKYKTETVEKTGYNLEAWGYTEQEKQEQERERINLLSMTRADVFEALILAKGLTKPQIRAMIENAELDDITKALYLNRFDESLNFYRGFPVFDMLGQVIGITPKQLDDFFKTKDYKYLTNITLTINIIPETAVVILNGIIGNTITVPYNTIIEYTVNDDSYIGITNQILLTDNETLEIELEPIEQ